MQALSIGLVMQFARNKIPAQAGIFYEENDFSNLLNQP
jgi:hypothetical protein